MSDAPSSSCGNAPGRRDFLLLAASGAGAILLPRAAAASGSTCTTLTPALNTVDVVANFCADPSGATDSTTMFQAALTYLESSTLGGGVLNVPPGNYTISSALTYTGNGLSIIGAGIGVTSLSCASSTAGISITSTNTTQNIIVRDLGFVPPASGAGGTALTLTFNTNGAPQAECLVKDVDFGSATSSYFSIGLILGNTCHASIRDCHYNGSSLNGTFAMLYNYWSGSNGVRFEGCRVDNQNLGFAIYGSATDLHLTNCHVGGGNGLASGFVEYGQTGALPLNGIYVSNCDFTCVGVCLNLARVNGGLISDSHFGSAGAAYGVTVVLSGCTYVQFSNCEVSGASQTLTSSFSGVGIVVQATSDSFPTQNSLGNEFNNITFANLNYGVLLHPGATNNTGREIRMLTPGGALLGPATYSSNGTTQMISQIAISDQSGNTTNSFEWISSSSNQAGFSTTDRYLYSLSK